MNDDLVLVRRPNIRIVKHEITRHEGIFITDSLFYANRKIHPLGDEHLDGLFKS